MMRVIFSFTRFTALSFICVIALAVVMGAALSSLLTRSVSDWEWQNTAALVRREVHAAGLDTVFAKLGGAEERQRWGREFSRVLTTLPEVVRVKVWDANATVLWSDAPDLIGRRFLDNEELVHALAGKVEVTIKQLKKTEQGVERRAFDTLAEVYVPILVGTGVVGVVEVYKTPERLMSTIRWARIVIWSISLAGGFVLYGGLLPLFTHVYRREVEEQTLRAHAARLETEVMQRTEQLLQAQKMQAVGLLAGGIAHDFNNLLTVITGRAEILKQRLPPGDHRGIDLILETAERASALTRQLLAFSRKQVLEQRVLDLSVVVADTHKMLRRVIGEQIELVTVLDPRLGRVKADRGQLEQVILNLAVNARDSMGERGTLTLQTSNVALDAASASRLGATSGDYVVLTVRDTGAGMGDATQARIFEPFFTTKEPGKGTGLGLSTVYGIVQQHDGYIVVESAPGQGATFRTYLPRVEAELEAVPPAAAAAPPARGSETILLVEDEEAVRTLAGEVLREYGYTVLEVADGRAALEVAGRHTSPIHLLLTDVVMPHVNGWELAQRLGRQHPAMKVLYMTGYSEVSATHDMIVSTTPAWLMKPFTPVALARRVREILDKALGDRAILR